MGIWSCRLRGGAIKSYGRRTGELPRWDAKVEGKGRGGKNGVAEGVAEGVICFAGHANSNAILQGCYRSCGAQQRMGESVLADLEEGSGEEFRKPLRRVDGAAGVIGRWTLRGVSQQKKMFFEPISSRFYEMGSFYQARRPSPHHPHSRMHWGLLCYG